MDRSSSDQPSLAVVLDNVHITYKVLGTGRRATQRQLRAKQAQSAFGIREVHAVQGVSFTAREGESIGIIGSNGSGKSSLMRAIAGLTPIDTGGSIYASSRPALLGVGAALLPKLSGAKNIILGGLALGFTRREITKDVPEIAKFAGLEDFIDFPMSTYSSGMAARLQFAIAAHRNHEILIIDEALSVGDARFRAKSSARIAEMREAAGTIFLVSHSMNSIRETCTRCIWLEKGVVRIDGSPDEVIRAYEEHMSGRP